MTARVLITRAPERSEALIRELEKRGINSFSVPVTRTVLNVENNEPPDLSGFDWLAFTSVNGVLAFARALEIYGMKLPESIKVAAVGNQTALMAAKKLGTPDLIPSTANGEMLAKLIIETSGDIEGVSVLWPCAQNALIKFGTRLTAAGISVVPWICYKTVAEDSKILKDRLQASVPWDLVLFAAPSAVRAFSAVWTEKNGFWACAIGSTTAEALKEMDFGNVVVSRGVNVQEIAETIADNLKGRNNGR